MCKELFLSEIHSWWRMVDARCVISSMTYANETRPLLVDVGLKFERPEMQIIRWMCDVSMKDRRTSEELIKLVGVVCCIPRQYVLRCDIILPAKDVFTKSDANKIQLIMYTCTVYINNLHQHLIWDTCVSTCWRWWKIISYLLQICRHHKHVHVLADDADIFVLLVYFIWYYKSLAYI